MDLQDYKIRNTTTCKCGYNFTIHDMKKLQRIADSKFYGGVVKHVDEIKCPKCNEDTLLLLKQVGQTYIVKDIAQKEHSNIATNQKETTTTTDIITESTTIEQEQSNDLSNEFICPVCQRSFKNKSGLSIHMKTHDSK